ncbi:hypothetical protein EON81_09350 [bacterium]|nr:MAG: hypothetical protein EON81_09350 [bacterium]
MELLRQSLPHLNRDPGAQDLVERIKASIGEWEIEESGGESIQCQHCGVVQPALGSHCQHCYESMEWIDEKPC